MLRVRDAGWFVYRGRLAGSDTDPSLSPSVILVLGLAVLLNYVDRGSLATAAPGGREFWGAALGHFSANYSFYFVMLWLPSFLVKAGGFSVPEMAKISAVIFGVYAISTAISGLASDRWIRAGASVTRVRKTFMLASAAGVGVTIAASAWMAPRSAVWLIRAAGICFGLGTPMLFAIGATLAGPRAAGRWGGAQNLAGQCAGIVAPLITGIIVDRTGSFTGALAISAASALLTVVAYGVVVGPIAEVRWTDGPVRTRAPYPSAAA